ncbi:MAG: acyl-CoA dehydratase activase-related protein [Clostridiales bacterium]|jgi:predicted nucleotide-binding protein (sugar kinase/HSP70/actin superfamily)|nr:acyl-CoA dehydratase activase-related protein [Clostridiales bacterium]MDR2712914.1 acyl-CoA dehydratase activase-related protein [Clostridiales bacterium]
MKIGLPQGLLYHRYQVLWQVFLRELGFEVISSPPTNPAILARGMADAISECCLPAKICLGHVQSLLGNCDYILLPRFDNTGPDREFCERCRGIYDVARHTYREAPLVDYNLQAKGGPGEKQAFLDLAGTLGQSHWASRRAYKAARAAQEDFTEQKIRDQEQLLHERGLKILLAGQPYLCHDPYITGPIRRLVKEEGGRILYSDYFPLAACRQASQDLSPRLYWTLNQEILGAILLNRRNLSGAILLTAYPCSANALANEMALRKIKDLPMIHLVLDGLEGEAGLETRIESFMDLLQGARN